MSMKTWITVRPATQANRFYTGDAKVLSEEVDSFLALHAKDRKYEQVAAVIVPHAGYYFSGNVQDIIPTPVQTLKEAKQIAEEEGMKYVYLGNV
jgi:AmmeMemoRadiSam system protein B